MDKKDIVKTSATTKPEIEVMRLTEAVSHFQQETAILQNETAKRAEWYIAFHKAQSEFSALLKDGKNPHFKSNYATLASVVETISDGLHNNGLFVMQPFSMKDNQLKMATIVAHKNGYEVRFYVDFPFSGNIQNFGSLVTYLRRYQLMAVFGLAPEDDDGNAASRMVAPVVNMQMKANTQSKPPTSNVKTEREQFVNRAPAAKSAEEPHYITAQQRAELDSLFGAESDAEFVKAFAEKLRILQLEKPASLKTIPFSTAQAVLTLIKEVENDGDFV